ncbi:MAG: hypothetical protein ACI8WB_003610 [Phenylobacterium sp.]
MTLNVFLARLIKSHGFIKEKESAMKNLAIDTQTITPVLIQTGENIHSIHSIWIAMLITGATGGLLSWYMAEDCKQDSQKEYTDKDPANAHITDKPSEPIVKHLLIGLLATFMVPLFLQMIGSTLLVDLVPQHHKFFLFLGFCSAAAYFSQRFASTMSQQILDQAKKTAGTEAKKEAHKIGDEVKKTAIGAEDIAEKALKQTESLEVANLALKGALYMIENEFERALIYLDQYLKLRFK